MLRREGDPKDLPVHEMRRDTPENLIYKIWVILSGNGNPEEGMMWKVNELMRRKRITDRILWTIVLSIITGAVYFFFIVVKDQILRGRI